MSSYLSLAAIENADLLAAHVQPILDSVISGTIVLFSQDKAQIVCCFSSSVPNQDILTQTWDGIFIREPWAEIFK